MTKTVLITGSSGLIGSQSARFFAQKGYKIVGIDNDLRQFFFGENATTEWQLKQLQAEIKHYEHHAIDIRDREAIFQLVKSLAGEIELVIHAAAQPSHDWAATNPIVDFEVNAVGTLNLLEATRQNCIHAPFIFTSTNNLYGDRINFMEFDELPTRWELPTSHPYFEYGIDEDFSIDATTHTLFGASKVGADILVQEYGRYYGMYTAAFRGGCLTGPAHSGTQLHGFLSYLMQCVVTGKHYNVLGYKGKQVRDNIHSYDLVNMFWHFFQNPRQGEVYNAGGSRHSHASMLETITLCENVADRQLNKSFVEEARLADHKWWVSDVRKFQRHYPHWQYTYNLKDIVEEVYQAMDLRLADTLS